MSVLTPELLETTTRLAELDAELIRRLWAALSSPPRPRKMTYAEFLQWADEDTLAEWVDGEVVMSSPAGYRHQVVGGFLARLMLLYAQRNQRGEVLTSPFQMKLAHSGREPDVLFVATDHLDRLQEPYLDGPADLVVEIVSPESIGRDRGEKYVEYQEAGVPEYWLIDPRMRRAEFYQLDDEGQYRFVATDPDGVYRSASLPGFWLKVGWLWQDPLPPVEDVLLEVGGEAYAQWLIERLRDRGYWPGSQ
ncbi:MAG: Uma2 family endonuclease [Chloroflexi bacterium]|nr:Uma2 family endonuclease [Chloroflexota bacterium]